LCWPRRGKQAISPASLPRLSDQPTYAVCAREAVENAEGVLAITAEDIF
jgi:hypothetical protein